MIPHRCCVLKAVALERGIEVRSIVEIGVYQGQGSLAFRTLFPDAKLHLVDPWKLYKNYRKEEAVPSSLNDPDYLAAYKAVKEMFKNDPDTCIYRTTSKQASKKIPDGLDLVFIDGNHSYPYVKQDILFWQPKIRPGGILAGHDYQADRFPGVVKAVDEILQGNILLGPDNTWIHFCR